MGTKSIYVTGDIANDYFLIQGERFFANDHNPNHIGTRIEYHKGGAHFLTQILEHFSTTMLVNNEHIDCMFGYNDEIFNNLPDRNNSYVYVSTFEKNTKKIWRVSKLIGFGNDKGDTIDYTPYRTNPNENTNLFIIDDAGIDFSANNTREWTELIQIIREKKQSKPFIILKKSGIFTRDNFFNELVKVKGDNDSSLITIVSIDDVRKLDVKVSSGISWEQSALDMVEELKHNDSLRYLTKSDFLIVTFKSAGALIVVKKSNQRFEYTLVFDPENMEEEVENVTQGTVIGRMSFFTAAFTTYLNLEKKEKNFNIEQAVKAGLAAIRLFYEHGYILNDKGFNYPLKEVAEALNEISNFKFSTASVPNNHEDDKQWSILIDNYSDNQIDDDVRNKALSALSKNIVRRGLDILKNIPLGKFGHLVTVDRSEIESFRNLKKIMETYISSNEGKKPLNIAVFGPPGAGKSFAVEEIGKEIMGKNNFNMLTFNLSQFSKPDDLIGALHQVRDCVIQKNTPIVFWDEFDSQSFIWLQYLLAPMQDGKFQDGQINHPIGKCIFVFAGATSYTMNAFGKFLKPESQIDFILKKGPDFISRINGYINILGPNKRQILNKHYKTEEDKWRDDPTDFTFTVRRALFIIGLLRLKNSDFPMKMDWGLLNAMIKVDKFKHGSRSMANLLIDIKQNNPNGTLMRSWLPSEQTLGLYFENVEDFNRLLDKEDEFLEMAWEIAPLIHSFWMERIDDPCNELSVEYSFLPVFIKESNVQAVRRIPKVLEAGGFRLTTIDNFQSITQEEYITQIENNGNRLLKIMAETEHELWIEFYRLNGWDYGEIRNDYDKKHNCMVPYDQLSENDQKKDLDLVLDYQEIVQKAGFGITIMNQD